MNKSKNKTIELIGQQEYSKIFGDKEKEMLKDIVNARTFTVSEETAVDIFIAGYICGKRAERKRKK